MAIISNKFEKAEEFNAHFSSLVCLTKMNSNEIPLLDRKVPFITKLIKSLIPSKALRPDQLRPRGLKDLASELCPVCARGVLPYLGSTGMCLAKAPFF